MPIERFDSIAVLRMHAPKANSMGPAMLTALRDALEEVRDSDAGALVITGRGRTFSAGLALPELAGYERDSLRQGMVAFEAIMESLLTLPMPTIAAINGHAIAGGCVLALMCDRRVMAAGEGRIGLNEVRLGIGLPPLAIETLRSRIPASAVAPVALAGTLFGCEEAHLLGLIDEVVAAEELETVAVQRCLELAGPPAAFAQIKSALIRPVIERVRQHGAAELENWLDTWFSPDGRRLVSEAVARLTQSAG